MNIDGSGAKQVKIGYSNTTSATLNLAANQSSTVRMWYDGNFYQVYGATANHTYSLISEAEINNATSATARLLSGQRLRNWINGFFSQNVETDKNETGKFPSVKAIYDWVIGKLENKADVDHTHTGYAATSHTHAIADITNLQTTLDGKAAASHTHTIAQVTNLQTTLNGKVTGTGVTTARYITESAYNALGTKDSNTLYFIPE